MKRTEKRFICLLLAAVLLLGTVPAADGAAAANGVILLAVNDSIPMTLSTDTMPFYSGSTLYVPWTLFNITTLGVTPSYNVLGGTLTLFDISSYIVFDLEAGTSTDSKGTGASWSTITKGSLVFVPAEYIVSYFGLGLSYLTSAGGYSVVRFTTGDQVYDDAYFLEKADNLIETRVAQFFSGTVTSGSSSSGSSSSSSSASSSGSSSSASSAASSGSTQTQTTQEDTASSADAAEPETGQEEETAEEEELPGEEEEALEEAEEEEVEQDDLYLLYTGAAGMELLAEELEAQGLTGAFFLTAQELEDNPLLLTRLLAGGHSVGILLEAGADAAAELAAACDAADAQTRHRLLQVYAGDTAAAEEAAALGYLVLTADSAGEGTAIYALDSSTAAGTLQTLQEAGRTICTLRLTSFQN